MHFKSSKASEEAKYNTCSTCQPCEPCHKCGWTPYTLQISAKISGVNKEACGKSLCFDDIDKAKEQLAEWKRQSLMNRAAECDPDDAACIAAYMRKYMK